MTNFDINGIPISHEINKGDIVIYNDHRTRCMQTVKIVLTGKWDGEKVEFKDDQYTIVRNKAWLTKLNS